MFRSGRRRVLFIVSGILPVGSLLWGITLKMSGAQIWNPRTLSVFAGIALISFVNAYLNLIKPVRDVAPAVRALLDVVGGRIIELGQVEKIDPRLNILLMVRPVRWLFLRRFLKVVWSLQMRNQPDVAAQFSVHKGVAGEAFRTRRPKLVNVEETGVEVWGLTARDAANFAELTAIFSYPIFEIDKNNEQTGRVIGTVNLDARAPHSFRKIARNTDYNTLLEEFSLLASKVCS